MNKIVKVKVVRSLSYVPFFYVLQISLGEITLKPQRLITGTANIFSAQNWCVLNFQEMRPLKICFHSLKIKLYKINVFSYRSLTKRSTLMSFHVKLTFLINPLWTLP